MALPRVLAGLTTAGLVSVADRPKTGRARPISLTPAGRTLLDQAHTIVLETEERMLAGLPPGEVRRLAALPTACAENLS
ncbi:MarR family winged helix-turn-helix transcriptional regulator [Actinoallomurus iriomotensis]|nr:hypothetical protein [Actinoallomurus iriomotensis]